MSDSKIHLIGKTLTELQDIVLSLGMPKFTARQIADWIYDKKVLYIDDMTNLSVRNRSLLSDSYDVGRTEPFECYESSDGTKKYLFAAHGKYVETVYIPDGDRATLCVSCQIGCKMGCSFCMTGKNGFFNHLSSGEIINQIMSIPEADTLTNIVYMGMGEPMDNLDEVMRSLEVMTSEWGRGWSPRRITVSTVGLIPGLQRFLKESKCHLAVSMHNPIANERLKLMPVQKAYDIESVVELIKQYDFTGQRRVSFEYTLFKGVNDSRYHARRISDMLKGLECRVNLIRFHSVPEVQLEGLSDAEMDAFREQLNRFGVTATVRKSRGEDIFAACGLLSSERNKES